MRTAQKPLGQPLLTLNYEPGWGVGILGNNRARMADDPHRLNVNSGIAYWHLSDEHA